MGLQNELTEEEELKEQHGDWIANLSDEEFKQWKKNQAGFATLHFAEI